MANVDIANDLAILAGESYLTHFVIDRSEYTVEPSGASAGELVNGNSANVQGSPRARIYVQQWEQEDGRSAVVTVSGFSALDSYDIIIDGVTYNDTVPADEATLWSNLETAINADADRVVEATASSTSLTLRYKADALSPHAGWSLGLNTSGAGGSTLEAVAEPVTLSYKVQGYNGTFGTGDSMTGWVDLLDDCSSATDVYLDHVSGGVRSWKTGGMQRLAVWVYELGGAFADSGSITLTPYRVAIGVSSIP